MVGQMVGQMTKAPKGDDVLCICMCTVFRDALARVRVLLSCVTIHEVSASELSFGSTTTTTMDVTKRAVNYDEKIKTDYCVDYAEFIVE